MECTLSRKTSASLVAPKSMPWDLDFPLIISAVGYFYTYHLPCSFLEHICACPYVHEYLHDDPKIPLLQSWRRWVEETEGRKAGEEGENQLVLSMHGSLWEKAQRSINLTVLLTLESGSNLKSTSFLHINLEMFKKKSLKQIHYEHFRLLS